MKKANAPPFTAWPSVAQTAGFEAESNVIAMPFSEIETEAENVLELLTVLRSNTHQGDRAEAQDTAAELTVALEHLHHHMGELLLRLQGLLEIEPS